MNGTYVTCIVLNMPASDRCLSAIDSRCSSSVLCPEMFPLISLNQTNFLRMMISLRMSVSDYWVAFSDFTEIRADYGQWSNFEDLSMFGLFCVYHFCVSLCVYVCINVYVCMYVCVKERERTSSAIWAAGLTNLCCEP